MSTCWQVWQFGADGCHIMHTKGKILQLSKGYWIKYVNSGDEHGYSGGTSVNVEELYIQLRWWNVKKTTLESAKKSYSNFKSWLVYLDDEVCWTGHTITKKILQKCTVLRKTVAIKNLCEGRLKSFELFILEKRQIRRDMIETWNGIYVI